MFNSKLEPDSIPLVPVHSDHYVQWLTEQDTSLSVWLECNNFGAKADEYCLVPDAEGKIKSVIVGYNTNEGLRWMLSGISGNLPINNYHIDGDFSQSEYSDIAIGWGLGQYCYQASPKNNQEYAQLYIENTASVEPIIAAITLVRNLINTPANLMMPEQLSVATEALAKQYKADFSEVVTEDTLQEHYPAVFAVGKASKYRPRILKMTWGDNDAPHLCLVGKGVCFDTGGLDLKPSKFMRNMKKDMGGAAHVLGLAQMIMALEIPVKLSVFIPAVDNAVSSNAFRPGDVINTRAGKKVEIDNTDAEGRLVLCDLLSEAAESKPDLIIDFATLTGAARVALGTEVPVFFANNSKSAIQVTKASEDAHELVWQLPLYKPYFNQLDSNVADMTNCSTQGYGGAITAALYLNEFVPQDISWLHFDVMAWNTRKRSGRPQGGEAMGLFAVLEFIKQRYH